ncbi:MAG: nucleotidyl transferase AbiEii/AbiGii toxin family protein [Candidatus Symbiothrix sp.]|jgi:predicted nucleotidyltransferase component of viral defense system|nr:nucleotidyl transferase AbiEii/AbiGii toxin family protein [Candidatus Symbiothrix sp.]
MIRPAEIQQIARKEGVRDTQIEKDYILSWILIGIAHNELLSDILVFKGGTVLKKFYFEDYRHSEDLDFTLLKTKTNEEIKTSFEDSFEFVKEEANIALSIVEFGEHTTGNINFYISYNGALGGVGKRVKVDISKDELLMFDPETKSLFDTYSDLIDSQLRCYSLPEVMTEKMRSLLSRQQPRDFYDLWYLSEFENLEMSDYFIEFEEKAKHKRLNHNNLEKRLEQLLPVFKARWIGSMGEQIRELPPFEQVERELGRHFRKIFKNKNSC